MRGDLICPRNFLFSVECKHYKAPPTLNAIVKRKVSQWDSWLAQNKQDSVLSMRKPMTIVKYNNTEVLVFLDFALTKLGYLFNYHGYYAFPLSDILKLNDDFFFIEE